MAQVDAGSAKRFGPRYGRSNRMKVAMAERQYRIPAECPYCGKTSVKRKAAGIFVCSKCKSTFTGRAYSAQKSQIKE